MWKHPLRLLLALLLFRIGPGDGEGGDGGEAGEEGGEDGEGEGNDAGNQEGNDEGEDADGGGDSRAENIKALREQRRQEREARIAAEARMQALEQTNRELAARLNSVPPKEDALPADADETARFVHEGNKALKSMKSQVDQATFIAVDAADKAEFYGDIGANPLIRKYKDRVEQELQRMIKNEGNRAPRRLIMRYLIGTDAEAAALKAAASPKPKGKDQEAAEERVKNARKAGGLPKSDVKGGERKTERAKREERLLDKFV